MPFVVPAYFNKGLSKYQNARKLISFLHSETVPWLYLKKMHTSVGIFVLKHSKYLFKGAHLPPQHSTLVCFCLYVNFFSYC